MQNTFHSNIYTLEISKLCNKDIFESKNLSSSAMRRSRMSSSIAKSTWLRVDYNTCINTTMFNLIPLRLVLYSYTWIVANNIVLKQSLQCICYVFIVTGIGFKIECFIELNNVVRSGGRPLTDGDMVKLFLALFPSLTRFC